jgi:3-hydroxy-D-aspartate aldolase
MAGIPPAAVGASLDEVDTPALVIELDAFERNLKALARAVEGRGVRVRAHAKTHKCPQIALRQIAAGAVGVCCQKVSEAEAMVDGGVGDVLVSNEIVGARKLERLAALARRARIGVCVDDAVNVRALSQAAERAGATLDVYVEVAREVAALPGLRFAGLQAYQGAAQHLRTMAERRDAIARAAAAAKQTRSLLESEGLACPTVTGAGSGTFASRSSRARSTRSSRARTSSWMPTTRRTNGPRRCRASSTRCSCWRR